MDLTVVICTFNRSDLLAEALKSISVQTLEDDRYEVVVVDNNSTDDTEDVVNVYQKKGNFRYLRETRQGLSAARNRGVKEAKGNYVAFLDDDAKADKYWCERIVNSFENVDPTPASVGGIIKPWYEKPPPEWFSDSLEIRTWGESPTFLVPPSARDGFSGSNMAFPRQLLLDYGGFSEELGMIGVRVRFGEETQLFRKIYRDHPYFWYDPRILVHHWVPAEKFNANYRIRRSFWSGKSYRRLQEDTGEHYSIIRRTASVVFFIIIRAPIRLLVNISNIRIEALKVAEESAWRIGSLTG